MNRFLVLAAIFVLFLSGCDRARQEIEAARDTDEDAEPAEVTFELQGVVVEASGSAGVAASTETRAVTPSPTARDEGDDEDSTSSPQGSPTTETTSVIARAAPGSIALKLTAFTIEESECVFSEGDVLMVAFTKSTNFDPADLVEARGFPNNLQGLSLLISGTVLGDECLLLATEVRVQEEGTDADEGGTSPTPTQTGEARRSPSPTPTD